MSFVAIKKYHSIEFSWLIQVFTRRVWQPRVYHHNNSTTWGSQRNLHLVDQLAPAGETTLNTNQWKPAEERSDNCLGSRVIVLAHLLLVQAHCPHQGWVCQYFGSCYTSGPWCGDTHDRSCHVLWSEGGLTSLGGEAVRTSSRHMAPGARTYQHASHRHHIHCNSLDLIITFSPISAISFIIVIKVGKSLVIIQDAICPLYYLKLTEPAGLKLLH